MVRHDLIYVVSQGCECLRGQEVPLRAVRVWANWILAIAWWVFLFPAVAVVLYILLRIIEEYLR
jgi:hypothetical protein